MNKGSLRLIAELTNAEDATFGSSHDNTYRGLSDSALDYMNAQAAGITAKLGKPGHGKDGPYVVTLRAVTTKNDGTVLDTNAHTFSGLSRKTVNHMNEEVLKVGHALLDLAKQKE